MAKYLNPKADLTFKKVFAEHKEPATLLSILYGYPQCLIADEHVVKFLNEYADKLSLESIRYSIDKYWDQISRERTAVNAAERKGEHQKALSIARNLHAMGMTTEQISQATGLTAEEIKEL